MLITCVMGNARAHKLQWGGPTVHFSTVLRFSTLTEINMSRQHGPTGIGTCCFGDPALVAKLNKKIECHHENEMFITLGTQRNALSQLHNP